MLKPEIQDAFNQQINAELYSAYLYLSMAAHFEAQSLSGMAQWMRIQAQEEVAHATKIFDFVNERNGRVLLAAIEGPKTQWDSPLAVFEDALAHEQKVSGLINDLSTLATRLNDHASHQFLEWFVAEQVEEENVAQTLVDQLKMVGSDGVGRYMLDEKLGQRTASPAAPATE